MFADWWLRAQDDDVIGPDNYLVTFNVWLFTFFNLQIQKED